LRRFFKYSLIALALLLAALISPYVFTGAIYYDVNLRPLYHGVPIKPIFPTNEFVIGALGIPQSGWQEWAIDLILQRKNDPELIEMVKQAAESEYPCTSASAKLVLFKLQIDPEQNLEDIFEMISERKSPCPLNLMEYKIDPEDSDYADVIVSILMESEIRDVQIAGRSALYLMGWTHEEIGELGLRPWKEYPE